MTTQPTEFEAGILQLAPSAKAAGSSAGELFGALMKEARSMVEQAGGDSLQLTKLLLVRLNANGLATSQEVELLVKVADRLFAKARGEGDPAEVAAEMRSLYQEMLLNEKSSQTVLLIMSILADASITSALLSSAASKNDGHPGQEAVVFAQRDPNAVDKGIIGGLAGGALIGGAIGGAGGAIIGGVIGGIVGGASKLV